MTKQTQLYLNGVSYDLNAAIGLKNQAHRTISNSIRRCPTDANGKSGCLPNRQSLRRRNRLLPSC